MFCLFTLTKTHYKEIISTVAYQGSRDNWTSQQPWKLWHRQLIWKAVCTVFFNLFFWRWSARYVQTTQYQLLLSLETTRKCIAINELLTTLHYTSLKIAQIKLTENTSFSTLEPCWVQSTVIFSFHHCFTVVAGWWTFMIFNFMLHCSWKPPDLNIYCFPCCCEQRRQISDNNDDGSVIIKCWAAPFLQPGDAVQRFVKVGIQLTVVDVVVGAFCGFVRWENLFVSCQLPQSTFVP